MNKRDFLIFLFKWRGTIFGTFFLIVGLVVLLVYLLPQQYVAVAQVIVEGNRSPTDRSTFTHGVDAFEVLSTETGIIKSRTVLEAVVDELKLYERSGKKPGKFKRAVLAAKKNLQDIGLIQKLSPRASWIITLDDYVKTEPVIGANIVTVSYKDEDPVWAAKITNSLIKNYISRHYKMYSNDGTSDLYLLQMNKAMERLHQRKKELTAYKLEFPLVSIIDRAELNQEISKMKIDKQRMKEQYQELIQRFAKGHTEVKLLQKKIYSINYSITKNNKSLLKLEQYEAKIAELQLRIHVEEEPFQNLKTRYNNARVLEAASNELVNVRVLDRATIPEKAKYSRLFFIILSIPAGIIISLSFGFMREYFDCRVFDPAEIERILGFPELGSIPETDPIHLTG